MTKAIQFFLNFSQKLFIVEQVVVLYCTSVQPTPFPYQKDHKTKEAGKKLPYFLTPFYFSGDPSVIYHFLKKSYLSPSQLSV